MSISVPTATETPAGPPPPEPEGERRWRGWAAVAAVLAIILLFADGESSAPVAEPDGVEAPTARFPLTEFETSQSAPVPDLTGEIVFPGEGRATAVAQSIHGQVVVGQRSGTAGAFVYTTDPSGELWTRTELAVSERAWTGTVSPWGDGFVIGGAIVGPGMGSSVPTLWSGAAGVDFTVIEHPFPGPGRIDRVRVIRGDLYVVGQASAPFSDTARPGAARFGRLLVGRPNAWTDITPPGASVLVTDVVGFGDGVVAVGGDEAGAALWWKTDPAADWVTLPLGNGVTTGVVDTPAGLVASVTVPGSGGDVSSHLMVGNTPRNLVRMGFPVESRIDWIAATEDGIIAGGRPGSDGEGVWFYRFGAGWGEVPLGNPRQVARSGHDGADGIVVGSAAGQPAMWTAEKDAGRVLVQVASSQWQLVSLLPGETTTVVDAGHHLFAYRDALDVGRLWVSTGGGPWRAFETVEGFGFVGATEHPGGWVAFGETGFVGVVYDAGGLGGTDVRVFPDLSIHHAARNGDVLTVLGTESGVPVRYRMGDPNERLVLDSLPPRIVSAGPILLGSSFRGDGVVVSVDDGVTWVPVPDVILPTGTPGDRALLVSRTGDVLVLDPTTLDPVPTGDRLGLGSVFLWGEGVAAEVGAGLRFVADPTEGSADVGLDVETGMHGVYVQAIPGPGRYALVSDRGLPAIYRWTGLRR